MRKEKKLNPESSKKKKQIEKLRLIPSQWISLPPFFQTGQIEAYGLSPMNDRSLDPQPRPEEFTQAD